MPRIAKVGKVRAAILCDDVRQEKNNKYILIGVYSGNIVLSEFPGAFAPQVFIEYEPPGHGRWKFKAVYSVDGKEKTRIEGEMGTTPEVIDLMTFALPPVLVRCDAPGPFTIALSVDDQPSVTIVKRAIQAGPLSSIGSPPPS